MQVPLKLSGKDFSNFTFPPQIHTRYNHTGIISLTLKRSNNLTFSQSKRYLNGVFAKLNFLDVMRWGRSIGYINVTLEVLQEVGM